ncbi:MAG: CHRD domain-containing protein [Anaerolineales bacterium]|nr:CHRD domain-containing protein [Anaerolineales bacterium]
MKKLRLFLLVTAFVVLAMMLMSATLANRPAYSASLRGENEVPPVVTDARGRFAAKVNPSETALRVKVQVTHISDVFAAHIHCGAPGVNGPVGVTLFSGGPVSFGSPGFLTDATFTAPNAGNACGWETIADVVDAMESGGAYVNVHTLGVPSGEIRGNIQ